MSEVQSALWFLAKFLFLCLLLSVWYYAFGMYPMTQWLVDCGNFILPLMGEVVVRVAERSPTEIVVLVPNAVDPTRMELFAQLDAKPMHYNLMPLLALFLATPGLSLRRKLLHCGIAILLAWPTYVFHLIVTIFQLMKVQFVFNSATPWLLLKSSTWWFFLKSVGFSSILMKQSGSMFLQFLIWGVFYFKSFRLLFYPASLMERYFRVADYIEHRLPAE